MTVLVEAWMASLIGFLGDGGTPYVPSAPVEIGTSGTHHGVAEAGSWQALIVMFALVIAIGAAVLMFAVRQRAALLERRRMRRMAAAAAAAFALMGDADGAAPPPPAQPTPPPAKPTPPRTTPATPGRPAPNA